MRIKKWEKWWWGITLALIIGLSVWIATWSEGIKGTHNGKPHVFSKTTCALWILGGVFLTSLWIWFACRFFFFKTNDFVCKYCQKEYGGSFETEKNVCQNCYKKRGRY